MLSGAQLGITVTGLVVGFIAEPSVSALLNPALTGIGIPDGAVTGISVVLAFVLATVVQMVPGELAPKNLAIAVPERLAKSLIGESHEQGELPKDTAALLDHALEFSDRTLHEVMVPRVDAVFVRKDASAAEAIELIGKHGHSNYPVLGDHPDDITGVLGVRELMALPAAQLGDRTAGSVARRTLLLPETTLGLPDAVKEMRERDDEFAVVLDEHGIITYEDIAEELLGDIADETDTITELAVADGTGWLVDAGRRLDEVAEATGIELPEEDDFDTVSGLIVDRLGRFPAIGDRVTVELPGWGDAVIDVRTLDRHVPENVRLERIPDLEAPREEQQA